MRAIAPGMPLHACPRQGRRRPTPRFLAAGANGTNMRQRSSARRKATANDSNLPKVHRREGSLATVPIKPGMYSAPLYICRIALLLLRQRRGAGLGELQWAHGRSQNFAIAPTHT
jgi:hypothetical protein